MAHKQAKSTKKFEKNKLKGTLDRRKEFAKVKQRHQLKAKKKQRPDKRAKKEKSDNDEADIEVPDEDLTDGDVNDDRFFQDTIRIPENRKDLRARNGDVPTQNGKRKRSQEAYQSEDDFEDFGEEEEYEIGHHDEMDNHKGQLESLAMKDPEFYKYLKENDAELLEFNEDDDLGEVDGLSVNDEDEQQVTKPKKSQKGDKSVVTSAMVKTWKQSMLENHSVRALRQLVLAFRAAAHLNDESDNNIDYRYSIPDAQIYHDILTAALKEVPTILNHHIPVKISAGGKVRVPTDTPKFKTLSPLIKSHTSSLHYLLSHLSDASTMRLTLQALEPLIPYLLQYRKFLKLMIKTVSSIWSDNSTTEATRVTAFLILRRLMQIGDPGVRETVLKSLYEGIVKGSRNTTSYTLPGINLMKNSAAEVWALDSKLGYTVAFTFIRQLAIHLRSNINKPTKDSYKTIYNWQFIHSVDFWSRVLATHANTLLEAQTAHPSPLRPLIYPVVQIALGVTRLIPTPIYFPLRFHILRALLRISSSTDTYIPLAPLLLEVLNSPDLRRPPKPATLKPLDFSSLLRAPTTYLHTRIYADSLFDAVHELLADFFALYARSIAFPELQLPVTVLLKRWLRAASSKTTGNKNAKANQALTLLVQKLEANARWITEQREKVHFTPKDRAEVDAFLKNVSWEETPLGAYVVGQRKLREERRKVLEQGRQEEVERRAAREDRDDED